MRRNRNVTVTVTCPKCEAEIEVEVSPPYPPVFYYKDGSGDPGSPAEIVDQPEEHTRPCSLECEDDDDKWYEIVMAAVQDADDAAYEREMESRLDRERDRD